MPGESVNSSMFDSESKDSQVVETWQRFVQGMLGVLALVGAAAMAHYYAPPETSDLAHQVNQLTQQVADLQRQGAFSPAAVDDARESVAYIYGIYRISGDPGAAPIHARVSGTGFMVAPGLLATNRHVAEPWYGDREAAAAILHGATPVLEKLEAYFPGSPIPVVLHTAVLANHGDLAILRMEFLDHHEWIEEGEFIVVPRGVEHKPARRASWLRSRSSVPRQLSDTSAMSPPTS